jgi:hypothetical protein
MSTPQSRPPKQSWQSIFAGSVGLFLSLALIKFGNPVILEDEIAPPTSFVELLVQPWPISWGYALLCVVLLQAGKAGRWRGTSPAWLFLMPVAWLGWQSLAALHTVSAKLTLPVLAHFGACTCCFYVGALGLIRISDLRLFWLAFLGGFFVVLVMGWEQHFGGLQRAREYFHQLPDWQSYPPDFLKRMASDRIYSTLFYPNALAGVIILLMPITFVKLGWSAPFPAAGRACMAGSAAVLGLGCLYWSGSKAGWLILLGQGLAAFPSSRLSRRTKWAVATSLLLLGVIGFWFKYQGYFARGASSVAARFDYWRAAVQTLVAHPLLGTGPGTFMVAYKQLKAPESEVTRLVHNDYLQQGSDSGLPGLLLYLAFVWGTLLWIHRKLEPGRLTVWAVWLGLAGIAIQGAVEFGLYIPAIAWPFFLLLGWLAGDVAPAKRIDKGKPPH